MEDRQDHKHWSCGHYHTDRKMDWLAITFENTRATRRPLTPAG